ncbi:galactokinase [Adhaeribacter pallidiroseus]|uniref:Galactokinase n=1 Tax=Adhaeribacter pallidiroseus TaxID=2072847 RepID=A0A369QKB7_9BACT|nr:galactokinase [Adhaeribacter pallidiroseus]RDC65363.1 Galactokinase [Adhaeribacter pallidiroseus]
MINDIVSKFKELYEQEPVLVRSPGRVNLIGEHTDYNNGFVLPAAINKEVYFAVAPNNTNSFRAYAFDLHEQAEFRLSEVKKSDISWANYLLGVIAQMQKAGYQLPGFDVVFGGNIPLGAGLSSSAAIECGLGFALNYIFQLHIEKFDLVKMGQKAEHEFAGVMSGIMDQFANTFGQKNHVVKLDCRSLEYQYYPFDITDYRIVLCDTQVKHSLASSEYNTRRKECEAGVALLQKHNAQVQSLRDVTEAMLTAHESEFEPVIYKRCRYVVQENNRVEAACQDLENNDLAAFGQKMFASHQGLQHDYEVSCRELDFLADLARQDDSVLGARMMGGGFGGCTINLVKLSGLDAFTQKMTTAYQQEFAVTLKTYVAEIVDGTGLVGQLEG